MHSDLIAKLEKLTGPDPEVDKLIAAHFHVKQITGTWPDWCIDPPVTASLDAAIALVERVLPGWHWSIYSTDGLGHRNAQIERPNHTGAEDFDGRGANPAIALLIATLKALEARDG